MFVVIAILWYKYIYSQQFDVEVINRNGPLTRTVGFLKIETVLLSYLFILYIHTCIVIIIIHKVKRALHVTGYICKQNYTCHA